MANKKEPENKEIRYDRFLGNQGDSMDFPSDTSSTEAGSDRKTSKKPDKPKEK